MKRICALAIGVALCLLTATGSLQAQARYGGEAYSPERFGVGFVFGDPTGFSWKYRISQSNAFDGALGFSPYFDEWRLHADYLWNAYPFNEKRLALYYGIGAAVGFGRTGYAVFYSNGSYFTSNRNVGVAARIPVGLGYMIPRSPLELYMEVAPLLVFAPISGVDVDAGLGARFYF